MIKQKPITIFLLLMFITSFAATVTVYTQVENPDGNSTDWLCEKTLSDGSVVYPGDALYGEAEYSQIVIILRRIIALLMVAGPVGGIIIALYMSVASVIAPASGSDGGDYAQKRRNSLLVGFGAPILVLLGNFIASSIFGFDIGCIIPDLPI